MSEDSSERSRRAVMLGIPAAITGFLGWEIYQHVEWQLDELEEHCDEKYGEGNWTMQSNGSSGMHQKWECVPNES